MPINEAAGLRLRSNLTKEQKREQEAAIYGLAVPKDMNHPTLQLSPDEIERMRAIVAQHDASNGGIGKIKEFDLNKPPQERYIFREFPKMVYDRDSRRQITVHSREQEQEALDAGYQLEPFPAEVPEVVELSAADQAEVDRLDKIARQKRQKKASAE